MTFMTGSERGPDVLLNPVGGPRLTDQEKEEIRYQGKMQALLARVTSETREQLMEYEDYYEDEYGDDEKDVDMGVPEMIFLFHPKLSS